MRPRKKRQIEYAVELLCAAAALSLMAGCMERHQFGWAMANMCTFFIFALDMIVRHV